MKWSWKNFFVAFFLIVGVIATYYIIKGYGFSKIIGFYRNVNIWILLLYVCTIIVLYTLFTWRWNVVLRSRGHKIPFGKLYIYRLIGSSINFFTPGPRVGGEPTQAALLGKHDVEFTEGLSTIMIDKIIDVSTCGLLFIVGALLVGLRFAIPHNAEIIMICGSLVFVTIIGLFYYQMLHDRHFFLHIFRFLRLDKIKNKTLKNIESKIEQIELIMIEFYKHNKKAFVMTLFVTLLTWVAMFVEYKLATTMLGLDLGVVPLFFIITFIGLAVLFPIPMAVGVLEAGQVSAFGMINLAGSAGVALAFMVRIKDLFFGTIGMILLALYGFDIKKTIKTKYTSKNGQKSNV